MPPRTMTTKIGTNQQRAALGAPAPDGVIDKTRSVLIVDDDPAITRLVKHALNDGYCVKEVSTGEETLTCLHEWAPDVILLDHILPDMDGYDVCRAIRRTPGGELTSILMISGDASTAAERVKGYDAGADDYLVKPFDVRELRAKVAVQFKMRANLLEIASSQAKLQLHSTRLEYLVGERTKELIDTRDATVFAMARLAESRDPETGEHLERMRTYSRILGRALRGIGPYRDSIDDEYIDDLYRASPLHDIGKVGIPDIVLLKPGRLSEHEYRIMQRHTVIGADALRAVAEQAGGGFLEMAVHIAHFHHERFDGSGYPTGLGKHDIPLSARIVAVADVFDALTSARVYKAAFEPLIARQMIISESGTHFDPAVVVAFDNCFDSLTDAMLAAQSNGCASVC